MKLMTKITAPAGNQMPNIPANKATSIHELTNGEASPPLVNISVQIIITASR